jgi:hypothetical protein
MERETNEQLGRNVAAEIDETELETVAAGMKVRTGIRAGHAIQPCL